MVDDFAQQGDATTITKARHSTSTRMSKMQESIPTKCILMSVHALYAKVVHLHRLYHVVLTIQHIHREHIPHDGNSRERGISLNHQNALSLPRNLHDVKEKIGVHNAMGETKEVNSGFVVSNAHARTILTTKITTTTKRLHAAFVPRVHL